MHNSTNDISDEVVKSLNSLAHNRQINKFKKIFNIITYHYKQCYLYTIKLTCDAVAMSSILKVIKKQEAIDTFNDLLQKDKGFAFSTLDATAPQYTLFKTLFGQLNSQQKGDYRVHLETKTPVRAQFILGNFYSNNKEDSSKPRIENSNTGSLDNKSLAQKRKRADSDEFSEFNPDIFFLNSTTLEEIINQYELDSRDLVPELTFVEEIYIEPATKRQRIL